MTRRMADDIEPRLRAITGQITDDQSEAALEQALALLEDAPQDPRPYRAAFDALSAAAARSEGLTAWTPAGKKAFYRRLLLQTDCAVRPLIFHHNIASLLTSENTALAGSILADLMPVLLTWQPAAHPAEEVPEAVVLFLLVVRRLLGPDFPQDWISSLHLARFPDFGLEDMALPYSVAFFPDQFGLNRDDLLQHYTSAETALAPETGLGLRHLLLLEWLGAPALFEQADRADLQTAIAVRLASDTPADEHAAARSLILRHWRPGSRLTAAALPLLEGADETLRLAGDMARPALSGKDARAARRRLGSRPWQAANALRSRALGKWAGPIAARRRPRVALCVSGQLRGWQGALKSWRNTLLAGIEADIFVHTWQHVGSASAQPVRVDLPFEGDSFCREWRRIGMLEGYDGVKARYPALFGALDADSQITAAALSEAYETDHVVVEDDKAKGFAGFSNQDKMHYKIHAAHQLAMAQAEEYDLILRLRPDLSLRMIGFDWSDMATVCHAQPVLFCDNAFGLHYGNPVIGDQVALGAPDRMDIYARTWAQHADLVGLRPAKYPAQLAGHVSLAHSCWLHGVDCARVPLKRGELLTPGRLSSAQILRALETDCAGRNDGVDTALITAARQDRKS